MKIAVLGAGAMGSLYGAHLSQAEDVTLVDSYEELVVQINRNGILEKEKDGGEIVYPAKAVMSGTDIGVQDLVIVFVKGIHTREVMEQNLSLIDKHTLVMTLQNGAGNNRDIARYVPRENILVGTSSHNSVVKGLGVFYHSGCGPTNIGPDQYTQATHRKAEAVAEVLRNSGFEVYVMENIQEVIWQKLFVNCAINGLSAVMKQKIGAVRSNRHLWAICKKIVYECVLVAEADGTYFDRAKALEIVERVCVNDSEGLASMYQDCIHGRKTEIDRINGVIVELAAQYRLDVPYNRMLVELVHACEPA